MIKNLQNELLKKKYIFVHIPIKLKKTRRGNFLGKYFKNEVNL